MGSDTAHYHASTPPAAKVIVEPAPLYLRRRNELGRILPGIRGKSEAFNRVDGGHRSVSEPEQADAFEPRQLTNPERPDEPSHGDDGGKPGWCSTSHR